MLICPLPPTSGPTDATRSFIALAPALAAHRWLSEQAPALAARGAAAAADVAAWAELAHAALNLMTEPFASRVQGVVSGVCAGGVDAGYRCARAAPKDMSGSCRSPLQPPKHLPGFLPSRRSSAGVSRVLEGAAAQLRALPAFLEAAGAPAAQPPAGAPADAPGELAAATVLRLREVGCMLVQLVSKSCGC